MTTENQPATTGPAQPTSAPAQRSGGPPYRPSGPPRGGDRGGDRGGPRRGGGGRPRYYSRRKVCQFCVNHIDHIDYKDVPVLRRYLSDQAKIESRRKAGTCSKHQRELALAIKRARYLAMVPIARVHVLP